jgi:hypothetical protein
VERACKYSIVDYPPGPRDWLYPKMIAFLWDAVERGLIEPTHEFHDGQRVFRRI